MPTVDSGESSAYRGIRNGARARLPPPAERGWTSAIAIAESMAEQNHFSPVIRQEPSPAGVPTVLARPTSEPPWDSVIHWPLVTATAGSVVVSRSSHGLATELSTSERDSNAAAPSAIATGQVKVADSGPYRCSSACCTTRAPDPQRRRASSW